MGFTDYSSSLQGHPFSSFISDWFIDSSRLGFNCVRFCCQTTHKQAKMASINGFFLLSIGIHKPQAHLQYRIRAFEPTKGIYTRRQLALGYGVSPLVSCLMLNWLARPLLALSVLESNGKAEEEEDDGVIGAIKSMFDPNEKTNKGTLLPKAYLKSAREVVKTLRESLKEDTKENAKFRRTADAAKESIRDYLSNWRGQKQVVSEKSYAMLEKAIRSLAKFYSSSGPSAELPDEIKQEILRDLTTAEEFL